MTVLLIAAAILIAIPLAMIALVWLAFRRKGRPWYTP
jgi:ABC-type phosphate transport system permease subunit